MVSVLDSIEVLMLIGTVLSGGALEILGELADFPEDVFTLLFLA